MPGCTARHPRGPRSRSGGAREDRSVRMLHRCDLCDRQKGGPRVGKTKRGKGSKLMAVADASGAGLAFHVASASLHEVTLVRETLASRHVQGVPQRLIGDRAYDSDPLDAELAVLGIEMIAPHRRNRKRARTQDGRKLRRYRRRWKIERLFVHLGNFRRLVVRYEPSVENFLGFVQLGCIRLLLNCYWKDRKSVV